MEYIDIIIKPSQVKLRGFYGVARTVGRFTPSSEAESASESGVPTPSYSERAACAFNILLIQERT